MAQIGIDVSKQKLDVAWLREAQAVKVKTRVFDNSEAGYKALQAWLIKHTGEPLEAQAVMMEATGIYHEALAYALHDAGAQVYVANPQHVKEFAKSLGRRSKTDKKDSIVLARFLDSRSHRLWEPEPEEARLLKALLSRLAALDKDILREENRREKAEIQQVSVSVRASIDNMLQALKAERQRLIQDIDDHIDGHPQLRAERSRLQSIPGVGPILSMELLAILCSRKFETAGQCAAFLGLVPIHEESGSSVKTRPQLSKTGSARVRAKLYMGAVVAKQHNPCVKAHYERLLARGKHKMSALGAAMRKLVQIAYGVLKHQTDYTPQGV